ncbi:MAG: NUDIX domain-containing protein [Frankiales bacterium]|nr:NUDIX domain-containing protein [Frankiales bacterium]
MHADAEHVLRTWAAPDAAQESLRREYLDFLARHADAPYRSCVPGHLTASALVVSPARDRVLLTLHAKIGRWLQMGGHCEPDDAGLHAAAAREAREESGIEGLVLGAEPVRLDRHRVGCHGGSWHLDVQYVAVAPPGAVHVISEESLDLRWWPVDALPELADDALERLVAAATAQR